MCHGSRQAHASRRFRSCASSASASESAPTFWQPAVADGGDLSSELLEAEVALQLGDDQRATELYEEARDGAESSAAVARAQLGLGRLAAGRGDIAQAAGLLQEALDSGELDSGDASAAANALGRIYTAQNRFDDAFALFERFLDEARTRGDQFDQVRFSLLLANAYVDHGDFGRAHARCG